MQAIHKLQSLENISAQQNIVSDNKNFISLKQGKRLLKVKLDEILYCEAKGNNTIIFLTDKAHLDIYTPLSKLHSEMPQDLFTRIHRSFIVNNSKVKIAISIVCTNSK